MYSWRRGAHTSKAHPYGEDVEVISSPISDNLPVYSYNTIILKARICARLLASSDHKARLMLCTG